MKQGWGVGRRGFNLIKCTLSVKDGFTKAGTDKLPTAGSRETKKKQKPKQSGKIEVVKAYTGI